MLRVHDIIISSTVLNLTKPIFSLLRKISSINPTGVIRAQDGRDRDRSTELRLKFTSTTCTSTGIVVLAEKNICSVWLRAGPLLPSSAVNNVAHSCVLENNTCVFAPWTSWYISQYEFDLEYHWRAWVLTQVVRAACHALTACSSNIRFVYHVVGWIARGRSSVGGNCAAVQGNDTNLAVIEPGSSMLTEDEVTEPWVSLVLTARLLKEIIDLHSTLDVTLCIYLISSLRQHCVYRNSQLHARTIRHSFIWRQTLITDELASVVSLIGGIGTESKCLCADSICILYVDVVNFRVCSIVPKRCWEFAVSQVLLVVFPFTYRSSHHSRPSL